MYMYYMLDNWQDPEIKKSCYTPIGQKHVNRYKTPSSNTFLMALDGDVDFQPEALQLLVDFLKRDTEVAAVCGRIHPTGFGRLKISMK